MNFKTYLESKNACREARAFVGDKTFKEAWQTASRSDWMLWLMLRLDYQDGQMYRLFGCWCAANTPLPDGRVTWDLLTDPRSRKAVLVAFDFANGDATREELDAARAAAADAAYATRAAYAAADAAYATRAAYAAADATDAAYAAARAAADATDAAYAAARAAADAADAALGTAWASQANELRRRVDYRKLARLAKKAGIR